MSVPTSRPLDAGLACSLAALLVVLVPTADAAPAHGPRSRVAIVKPGSNRRDQVEVRTRLRAELEANGFEVVDASASRDPRLGVEAALEECDAVAAYALVSMDDGTIVDVWVSDAITDKTLVRRFFGGTSEDSRLDPSLLAIEAVELLRASLVELEAARSGEEPAEAGPPERLPECEDQPNGCGTPRAMRPAARTTSPTPLADYLSAAAPIAEAPWRPLQIGAGAAVGWVRDLGVQGGPTFSVSYVSPVRLGARLTLVGPLFGAEVTGRAGSADIRELRLTLAATYRLDLDPDLFRLEPYLAFGVQEIYAEGTAEPPYVAADESEWSAVFDAGLRLSLWLDPHIAFELGAHGAVTLPGVELELAGEAIAVVDRPALHGTLGILVAP